MKGIWIKRLGTALLIVAGMFGLLAVMMVFSPVEPDDGPIESLIPGLFFGGVFLIPGMILYRSGHRKMEEQKFEKTLAGYVRSLDRFTSAELATKTGLPEMEAEQWVMRLANEPDIDLVLHRPDRTWLHRGRLADDDDVIDHCSSCGADVGKQVILAGEKISCQYCGKNLTA